MATTALSLRFGTPLASQGRLAEIQAEVRAAQAHKNARRGA
jgi:hypothetical protein